VWAHPAVLEALDDRQGRIPLRALLCRAERGTVPLIYDWVYARLLNSRASWTKWVKAMVQIIRVIWQVHTTASEVASQAAGNPPPPPPEDPPPGPWEDSESDEEWGAPSSESEDGEEADSTSASEASDGESTDLEEAASGTDGVDDSSSEEDSNLQEGLRALGYRRAEPQLRGIGCFATLDRLGTRGPSERGREVAPGEGAQSGQAGLMGLGDFATGRGSALGGTGEQAEMNAMEEREQRMLLDGPPRRVASDETTAEEERRESRNGQGGSLLMSTARSLLDLVAPSW
jgi:hypothetical protein